MNITHDFFKVIFINFTMERERSFKNKIPSQYGVFIQDHKVVIKNDIVIYPTTEGMGANLIGSPILSDHV